MNTAAHRVAGGRRGFRGARRRVRFALGFAWAAGRRDALVIAGAQASSALSATVRLVIAGHLLAGLEHGMFSTWRDATPLLALLVAVTAVGNVAGAAGSAARQLLADSVQHRASSMVVAAAAAAPYERFELPAFSALVQRCRDDAAPAAMWTIWGAAACLNAALTGAGLLAVVCSIAPGAAAVAALSSVPLAVLMTRHNRAQLATRRALTHVERDRLYHERLLTDRSSAAELRSLQFEGVLQRRHGELWGERNQINRRLAHRQLRASAAGSLAAALTLTVAGVLVLRASSGSALTLADGAVAVVAMQQLAQRLQTCASGFAQLHKGLAYLDEFRQFTAPALLPRPTVPAGISSGPACLSIRGVSYRYPGAAEDALHSIDLELRRGEVVAIIGANGSGKSTLLKILAGVLEPTAGELRWDGHPLHGGPQQLRERSAVVYQDFARFELGFEDAITAGRPARDRDLFAHVVAVSGLQTVHARLQRGRVRRLGKTFPGGSDLSGGEWQRVAIARALYRQAPLVLLDEPSSFLDTDAEAALLRALGSHSEAAITVIVTHRASSTAVADRVVVLDGGRVIHDPLDLTATDTLPAGSGSSRSVRGEPSTKEIDVAAQRHQIGGTRG